MHHRIQGYRHATLDSRAQSRHFPEDPALVHYEIDPAVPDILRQGNHIVLVVDPLTRELQLPIRFRAVLRTAAAKAVGNMALDLASSKLFHQQGTYVIDPAAYVMRVPVIDEDQLHTAF
jgi:hypothetical protein